MSAGAGAEERARSAVRAHLVEAFAVHPAPEVAWGLVLDGRLVDGENLDRAFRIASMTKCFTAAAVLGIRYGAIPSRRRLDLDDALAEYVRDAARPFDEITVRDALTMAGGLPTDDPWADRLEAMTGAELDALIARSPLQRFVAGTGYEYSNLGYALLGRVVEEATGRPYTAVVAEEILVPLGLVSTGFDVADLDPERVVPGFRRTADDGLEELAPTRPGAFSAIGGLWSTVPDIAAWIARLLDARPDRWARALRDVQQPQRFIGIDASAGGPSANSYGYGLHSSTDPVFGEFLHHSGGYPGFGSHMRWHPATRSGVIVFGNVTYFPARTIATGAAEACVTALGYVRDPDGRRGTGALRGSAAPSAVRATEPPSAARVSDPAGVCASAPSTSRDVGAPSGAAAAERATVVEADDTAGTAAPVTTEAGAVGAAETHAEAEEQRAETPAGGRPVPPSERLVERLGIELPVSAEARRIAKRVEQLLRSWDDAEADALFSPNMDLDVPRAERRMLLDRVLAATGESGSSGADSEGAAGPGVDDPALLASAGAANAAPLASAGKSGPSTRQVISTAAAASAEVPDVVWTSPTRARWTVRGPNGTRAVALELTPFRQVQKLTVSVEDETAEQH